MSLLLTLILTLTTLQSPLIHAQIRYDSKTNHLLCPAPNTQYCAAASLQSSTIISCTPQGTVEIRSCDIEYRPPLFPPPLVLATGVNGLAKANAVDIEQAAFYPPSYESSPHLGNAVCAFNGTGYTLEGLELSVPETVLCDDIPPFPFTRSFAKDNSDTGEEERDGAATIGYPYGSQSPVFALREDENLAQYSSYYYFPVPFVPHLSIPSEGIPMTRPLSEGTPISHRTSAGEELIASCSNPWSRQDAKTADILTLNIVLVIPTTRVKAPGSQSRPLISTPTIPSVPVLTATSTESSTTLIPSCHITSSDGISGHGTQTTLGTVATLTPWGDPTMGSDNGSGARETGMSNSGDILRSRTAVFIAGLVLTLWVRAGTLFG
ncbi:hypothetical protein BDW71DRAFT_206399 [Aspergillus fruticulosus]